MVKLYSFVNEKKIANKINELIEEGNTRNIRKYMMKDNNIKNMLSVYVKYLKNEEKLNKNQIRDKLDDFMIKYYPKFVMADWDSILESIVIKYTKPHKREYKIPKNIEITKEEMDRIENIKDIQGYKLFEVKKILFIMLVLAKLSYNGNGFWVNNYKSSDIFELARYKYDTHKKRVDQRERLFGLLEEQKLIELSLYNSNIRLLYGQDKNVDKKQVLKETKKWGEEVWKEVVTNIYDYNEEEVVIKMNDDNIVWENMILKYLEYNNYFKEEGKYFCKECGKEIKKKGNNSTYCDKCSKDKIKENDRIRKNNSVF